MINFFIVQLILLITGEARADRCLEILRGLQQEAEVTAALGDEWPVDAPERENYPYEDDFRQFLGPSKTFNEYFLRKKKQGERVDVLDLYGSGDFVTDATSIDSMTALRLRERRDHHSQEMQMKVTFVEGNIYSYKSWNDLNRSMNKRKIESFTTITCRPHGGIAEFTTEKHYVIFLKVLKRAYRLLSPNHGELFVELPVGFNVSQWVSFLRQNSISIDWTEKGYKYGIRITRDPGSPEQLPENHE